MPTGVPEHLPGKDSESQRLEVQTEGQGRAFLWQVTQAGWVQNFVESALGV